MGYQSYASIIDQFDSKRAVISAANSARTIDVIVFGAGNGGLCMLQALCHYEDVRIRAIVDITEDALAFEFARSQGIATSTDGDEILKGFDNGILIDVTGDPSVHESPRVYRRHFCLSRHAAF